MDRFWTELPRDRKIARNQKPDVRSRVTNPRRFATHSYAPLQNDSWTGCTRESQIYHSRNQCERKRGVGSCFTSDVDDNPNWNAGYYCEAVKPIDDKPR
jgi:hypothetical protein